MNKRLHSFIKMALLMVLLHTGLEMRSQMPIVLVPPTSPMVCPGSTAYFTVVALNPTGYQWQVNTGSGYQDISDGSLYSGANSATLTVNNAMVAQENYTFRCIISGVNNISVTTNDAALTFLNARITQNPFPATICQGETVIFDMAATLVSSYRWQVDNGNGFVNISNGTGPTGGIYSGVQSSVMTISNASSAMSGYTYRCVVSDLCNSGVASSAALFTVLEYTTYYEDYDGDGYGNASVTTISCTGAPGGFVVNALDCDDNDVTVYPGAVEICGDGIDNNCDGSIDEGCEPASIAFHPSASTVCAGNDAAFSITADHTTGYQWQVNTGNGYINMSNGGVYSGASTATLTLTGVLSGMNGYSYRCVATGNNASQAVSNPATLTVQNAPAITQNPIPSTICQGDATLFYVAASSATSYQWQVNGGNGFVNISDGTGSTGGTYFNTQTAVIYITDATTAMSGYTYRCVVSGNCGSGVASSAAVFTVLENITYYEDYDGDGYGNASVTTSSCSGAPGGFVANALDCDDNDVTVYPGAVEICGDGIDNNCDGNVDEDCPIVYHPQRTTKICYGENATLWITAHSGLTYQWQLYTGLGYTNIDNGGIYSGTNTATLTITNPSYEESGLAYRCAISVIEDGIQSTWFTDPGVLHVTTEVIVLAQPQSYEACQQETVSFFSFAAGGDYMQWQVNDGSGFINLENGDAPSGGTYYSVNTVNMYVSNLTLDMTGYTYRCVFSNDCFTDGTSEEAELTIYESPEAAIYYEDYDGDGYGNPESYIVSCYLLEDMDGYVFNGDDCNDDDPNVYPGSGTQEICGDGIDNDCDGEIDEDCEICETTSIWDGSDWFPTGPSFQSKLIFMADYTITGDFPACSIKVMDNITVTVTSGSNLAVFTNVEVQPLGHLIFNNNATLLQHPDVTVNENTGSITFHRDSNALYNLDYTIWSSPTSGTQTLKAFSDETLDANFFVYNTALSAYSNYLSASGIFGGNPNEIEFTPGKGYLVRMPAGLPAGSTSVFNGVFEGTPNNGDISIPLSTEGGRFNAVGNPYPSPINISAFIEANEEQMDNGTLYFWRKTNLAPTATYVTVTNMGSAAIDLPTSTSDLFTGSPYDWVIQPGQGFLFKASSTANALNFNNNMRTFTNDGPFFRPAVTPMDEATNELSRLWLDISNNGTSFGQTVIGYSANTTNGLDFGWDGRLYNDSDLSVYTKSEEAKLAIQARASFTAEDAVAMSYKANNGGTLTLKLSNYDGLFTGDQQVYLKDNVFNIYHDLKAGAYTFSTEAGTFEDRFEVVYQNAALGTDNPIFDANNVIIYKDGSTLKIDAGRVTMKQIDIYDVRGRLLYSASDVNATTFAISDLAVAQQVLVVQITTEDNARTSKKIIY